MLPLWPLIVVIEDCFVPQSATALFAGLRGVDEEALAMTIRLWALDAEDTVGEN